jgi:hypothetical protein
VIARDPARLPACTRECVEVVQGSHGDFNVVKDTIPPARNSREHTRRIPARHLRYRSPCLDRPQASVCRQSSFVVDTHDPGRQVTNAFGSVTTAVITVATNTDSLCRFRRGRSSYVLPYSKVFDGGAACRARQSCAQFSRSSRRFELKISQPCIQIQPIIACWI